MPVLHQSVTYSDEGIDLAGWRSPLRQEFSTGVSTIASSPSRADGVRGSLQAWDPVRQELAWEIPLHGYWNPGTMTTAGNLVFQGRADGNFVAYDANSGEELWMFDLGLGISAPPNHLCDQRAPVRRAARRLGWIAGRVRGRARRIPRLGLRGS